MSALRLGVVIPALDEERGIERVLEDLPRHGVVALIVADNGSRDRTADVARAGGATVVRAARRGYGSACLAGIAALPACDAVVFLDADHSDHADELPRLLAPIERGDSDLVIGTRMRDAASRAAVPPVARFGNRLASRLLRAFFGARCSDLGPFRVIRRDVLDALALTDPDFGWTMQMQARALRLGYRVSEVPVSYRPRVGRSKISGTVRGSMRAGAKILVTAFCEAASRRASSSPAVQAAGPSR